MFRDTSIFSQDAPARAAPKASPCTEDARAAGILPESGENTSSRVKRRCSRLTVGWVRCSLLIYVRLEAWPATVFPLILGVVVPVLVGVLVVLLGAFLLLCSFVFLVDNVF